MLPEHSATRHCASFLLRYFVFYFSTQQPNQVLNEASESLFGSYILFLRASNYKSHSVCQRKWD